MRSDLAERFQECLKTMTSSLWQKERRFPNMFNLKPQIAFHGTRQKSLPSIGESLIHASTVSFIKMFVLICFASNSCSCL